MSESFPASAWFDDRTLAAQLPFGYRLLAAALRLLRRLLGSRDRYPGQWRAWLALANLQRRSGRGTARLVEVAGRPIAVDLADPRAMVVLCEVRGTDAESCALQHLLRQGDTFLDIGANHGAYAIVATSLVGAYGAVLAFEPQPGLATLLRRSFDAAGRDPADVMEVACSDTEREVHLHVPRLQSGSASLFAANAAHVDSESCVVRAAPLDHLLMGRALPGSMVIKLDIEGSELAFLHGARATLRARRPALLLELNPSTSRGAGYNLGQVVTELAGLGYRSAAAIEEPARTYKLSMLDLERQRNVLVLADAPTEDGRGPALVED